MARFSYKQVIVVRKDLGMSCGKTVVQAAHAAVMAVLEAGKKPEWRKWLDAWLREGQKKVAVRVESEEELLDRYREAAELGLPVSLVRDAGLTELPPGTLTAIAVGPGPEELVDRVTGRLRLV